MNWFARHKDTISAVTSLFGVPLALFGAWIAIDRISETSKQLEASTIYQLQSDGRDLIREMSIEPGLYEYVTGQDSNIEGHKGSLYLSRLVNFYSSVVIQRDIGVIGDHYWKPMFDDLCGALEYDRVRHRFEKLVKSSDELQKMYRRLGECN